jgi:TonB-dependent receptor
VAQVLMLGVGMAQAQEAQNAGDTPQTVEVTGQRRALETAQARKRDADEILDSVDADEAGKMPDKSITEVLQRVVGVTVQRQRTVNNDATHFSEEGSGIRIRSMGYVGSGINGREIFSAGWPGKELSWGAVTPELIVGVDTYKNPSAAQIEGAISGIVMIRTGLPFDYGGTKARASFGSSYVETSKKFSPNISGMYTTVWDNDFGHWGALVDLATNSSTYAGTSLHLGDYMPVTGIDAAHANTAVFVPKGASWGSNVGESDRQGFYGARTT